MPWAPCSEHSRSPNCHGARTSTRRHRTSCSVIYKGLHRKDHTIPTFRSEEPLRARMGGPAVKSAHALAPSPPSPASEPMNAPPISPPPSFTLDPGRQL